MTGHLDIGAFLLIGGLIVAVWAEHRIDLWRQQRARDEWIRGLEEMTAARRQHELWSWTDFASTFADIDGLPEVRMEGR